MGSSSQDGDLGRNVSFPHTTKRRMTANLKTNNQTRQEIRLCGTPTVKELKKHSSRRVGGAEMGSQVGREDP